MNGLSWILYAADAVSNVQTMFIVGGFIGLFSILLGMIIAGIAEIEENVPSGTWKRIMKYVWAPALAFLLASVLPSQTTIYMIAASQAGERVLKSPDGSQIMSDLTKLIEKKLHEQLTSAR